MLKTLGFIFLRRSISNIVVLLCHYTHCYKSTLIFRFYLFNIFDFYLIFFDFLEKITCNNLINDNHKIIIYCKVNSSQFYIFNYLLIYSLFFICRKKIFRVMHPKSGLKN
jgi:hypothetical protein